MTFHDSFSHNECAGNIPLRWLCDFARETVPGTRRQKHYGQSFAFELSFRIPKLLQPMVDFEAARRRPARCCRKEMFGLFGRGCELSDNERPYGRRYLGVGVYPIVFFFFSLISLTATAAEPYKGQPYHDNVYHSSPQVIPGRVMCAYYDLGGEGVAYHDSDATNKGSGKLNPADGSYLNEFRMHEGVDTSYTKYHDDIDNNPYEVVHPPKDLLYVGWTDPGEWFNLTVNVKESELYSFSLLYTSKNGGAISLDVDGKNVGGLIKIDSTYNALDPVAWRQWHHWNYAEDLASLPLSKGMHVLTVNIVLEGNMNLAYLDFAKAK
jgi:hypothetical protein